MRRLVALGAVIAVSLGAGAAYGFFVHRNRLPPYGWLRALVESIARGDGSPAGRWTRLPLGEHRGDRVRRLEAIGYLAGVTRGAAGVGVVVDRLPEGTSAYYLAVSGNAAAVELIDRKGRVRHRWQAEFDDVFPEDEQERSFFRYAHALPNGDLLAIFEGVGLVELDRDSNVVWARRNGAHHKVLVGKGGEIWVLTRRAHAKPSLGVRSLVLEDHVTVLDAEGREIRSFSLLDAIDRSDYSGLKRTLRDRARRLDDDGDLLHTNDLDLIDMATLGGLKLEGPGLLLSSRYLHAIFVVDLRDERVVWALAGLTARQHDPDLLPNGDLLVFDNRDPATGSRVLELEPGGGRVVWRYPAEEDPELFSQCCGAVQRLPNGHTLVTFTGLGLAREVDREGGTVWEWRSPYRAGEQGEFIAQLLEMERLPADFPTDWLDR